MVLGILTALAACPAIVGTSEAVRQGQKKDAKDKHRGVKSNLTVSCHGRSQKCRDIDRGLVVLRDKKLYISVASDTDTDADTDTEAPEKSDHPFTGYFLPFPDTDWGRKGEGLVSTISDDPPQLNWIYVDEDTFEVKHGLRADAEPHYVGPWDCTPIDKRITFDGWEGFVAVEESAGSWVVYFDLDDDGLVDKKDGRKTLEITLTRRERRKRKPSVRR